MTDLPTGVAAIFAELKRRQFRSMAEAQAYLDRRLRLFNDAPQAELGGLSPARVDLLSDGDWINTGILKISRDLALAEVAETEIFFNARLILRVIGELGTAKATAGGWLARSVVAIIFEQMRWVDPEERDEIREMNKVIDEIDVGRLSSLHYLLDQLGLIRRRKGFILSRAGREVLADERAGELYCRLIITGFRDLDMREERPEDPEVQRALPFALYQIGRLAGDWIDPAALAPQLWLGPWAGDRYSPEPGLYDAREVFTEDRVIWPLLRFGFLEMRYLGEGPRLLQPFEVRKTALFDRVVAFEF